MTGQGVEILFDIPDKIPNLFTDEAKVTQILRNLISNALKFTEKGEVRVNATFDAERGRLNLSVRDTGIGIATEDLSRVFDEFSQVDTKIQKRVKGTGLGLPLARSLAELLGGELTVQSVLGQGSVFTLSIPHERGDPSRVQRLADGSRKRVLLIDDDETFRYVMRQIIGNEPRYEFSAAV